MGRPNRTGRESDQSDMFGAAAPPPIFAEGLRIYRARLAQDRGSWPELQAYLKAVVTRFERLCAGETEADIGPFPEYPDSTRQR
jgi:hypothetical protein